jgi:hypothetical protein
MDAVCVEAIAKEHKNLQGCRQFVFTKSLVVRDRLARKIGVGCRNDKDVKEP